ncbi:helix-turn-helix domain-containing protein [Streptomyces europaeiscabiei]|uniref:helix-turn-helix domain-containing protein n=1 Tax=Streptomyces europaeiscabiei TaxID=146819 RepID=UPI0029BC0AD7|nr:helix-turn-helix domain-containing protein [Streptomyces europaeiscabiei]MDX3637691.1 helix-turn-helix domain-containing protein [Streptomyces europaeiscabiei]MDX3655522.1 helix-turn-helix domain-containing protein [Streptomyces europaeiscabiei]
MALGDNQFNNPLTEDELQRIRDMAEAGHGRNEISRELGRATRSISVHAARMGITFDRTMTEEATRARKADLEERRVILAEALQSDAEQLTEQLWQPAKVYRIGGSSNSYTERDVDEPPADAKKDLMAAAGIAIEKSLKLVPPEREDTEGLAAVDQWLRGMMHGGE